MKKVLIYSLFLILIFSCYRDDAGKNIMPDYEPTLSKEELVDVLTDMHLVQATLKFYQNKGENITKKNEEFHYKILKKYNISKKELEENIHYYKHQIDDFNEIYEDVLENLSKLESDRDQINEKY